MTSAASIIAGTPLWVWGVLALIVYLGGTALRPGRRSPARLSLIPGVFIVVALFGLLTSGRLSDAAPFWLGGCLAGFVIGGVWASVLPVEIDRQEGVIGMPGTAFWLVTGLVLFGLRYALEVHLAFHRDLAAGAVWSSAPLAIAGLGTGMSVGWWAALMRRYLAA